jgi:hypothetical protein
MITTLKINSEYTLQKEKRDNGVKLTMIFTDYFNDKESLILNVKYINFDGQRTEYIYENSIMKTVPIIKTAHVNYERDDMSRFYEKFKGHLLQQHFGGQCIFDFLNQSDETHETNEETSVVGHKFKIGDIVKSYNSGSSATKFEIIAYGYGDNDNKNKIYNLKTKIGNLYCSIPESDLYYEEPTTDKTDTVEL